MAYNAISGTLIAQRSVGAGWYDGSVTAQYVSGNLSTSDGSSVINIPRVTNPVNNGLLTNVGGDANGIACESNITFDGQTLNITGELTASIGLSASYLEGDGSRLTNIAGIGGGSGIFTTLDSSNAYVTSSLNIGGDLTPNHKLVISGSVSSSVNISASSFYGQSLVLGGGMALSRIAVTTHITASKSDYFFGVDTSSLAIEIRLLDANQLDSGQMYVIKDEAGNANNNNITVLTSGSQTIDGQNSIVLMSPNASIQVYCNGSNKYFIY
jgi:hypothetical protein